MQVNRMTEANHFLDRRDSAAIDRGPVNDDRRFAADRGHIEGPVAIARFVSGWLSDWLRWIRSERNASVIHYVEGGRRFFSNFIKALPSPLLLPAVVVQP
jgi:hypothetical protein